MKRFLSMRRLALLLALLTAAPLLSARADGAVSDAPVPGLRFGADGRFTVMVLSDMQDTQFTVPYLLSCVNSALEEQQPDLVVLLGDQLAGASPLMRLGDAEENAKKALDKLLAPIVSRGIPFAPVLGAADLGSGIPRENLLALYRSYAGCMLAQTDGSGAYCLPVYAHRGADVKLNLFFFDANAGADSGQVAWYIESSDAARAQNGGNAVPAACFQHAALSEVYELLGQAGADDPGAIAGAGSSADRYYAPDAPQILSGSLREAPRPSAQNAGQLAAFVGQGDIFAAFFGNDHTNDFVVSRDGVDLAACPAATYTGSNSRSARGLRLLRFGEDNVRDYETMLVRFSSYESISTLGVIPYYLLTTTRVSNAAKVGIVFAVLVAALAAMALLDVCRARKRAGAPDDMGQADTACTAQPENEPDTPSASVPEEQDKP